MSISDRYLCFRLNQNTFGLKLETIEAVISLKEITPLPYEIANIKGVTKYKTFVIPVFDIKRTLKMSTEEQQNTLSKKIVIIKYKDEIIGLIVDEVKGILDKNSDAEPSLVNLDIKDIKLLKLEELLDT